MGMLIGILAVAGLIAWFMSRGGGNAPDPEDDVTTPIDREALEEAERELLADGGARPIGDAIDEEDWGPGTGGSSGLPGLF
jgi:hypothetical protein